MKHMFLMIFLISSNFLLANDFIDGINSYETESELYCTPTGESCTLDTECCSGDCGLLGCKGVKDCSLKKQPGESCTYDFECCSDDCDIVDWVCH